jgi:hypothetical protein
MRREKAECRCCRHFTETSQNAETWQLPHPTPSRDHQCPRLGQRAVLRAVNISDSAKVRASCLPMNTALFNCLWRGFATYAPTCSTMVRWVPMGLTAFQEEQHGAAPHLPGSKTRISACESAGSFPEEDSQSCGTCLRVVWPARRHA